MLLCLDIGNTQIHGGVFDGEALRCQFRKSTQPLGSSDELGIFLTAALQAQDVEPRSIARVALCSVVPAALHSAKNASLRYFQQEPFVLQAGVKTGLKVRYVNPLEVGADRIAGSIAAVQRRPGHDLIVVDCGTATTFDVVTAAAEWKSRAPARSSAGRRWRASSPACITGTSGRSATSWPSSSARPSAPPRRTSSAQAASAGCSRPSGCSTSSCPNWCSGA
jgi:hypothetical protein